MNNAIITVIVTKKALTLLAGRTLAVLLDRHPRSVADPDRRTLYVAVQTPTSAGWPTCSPPSCSHTETATAPSARHPGSVITVRADTDIPRPMKGREEGAQAATAA